MEKIGSDKTIIGLSGFDRMDRSGMMKKWEIKVSTEVKQNGQDCALSGWFL